MSDLTIRGGGAVSVETEALTAEAVRLGVVGRILEGWAFRAGGIQDRLAEIAWGDSDPGPQIAARELDTALAGFRTAAADTASLSSSLHWSAAGYGAAEWLATFGGDLGARITAGMLGMTAPGLLLSGASAAVLLAPGFALGAVIAGPEGVAAVSALVEQRGLPVLSDPAFVSIVRAAGGTLDEFIAGLFRSGGLFGVGAALGAPENAALLLAAASAVGLVTGARALRETEVRIDRWSATPASTVSPLGPSRSGPPVGFADLAERVPSGPPGAPQIRIERYEAADGPRWIVYSSGTVDFGAVPHHEPYDSTSNLHMVADASAPAGAVGLPAQSAAGERAVRAAMEAAGVGPGDPVLLAGHSAGGTIAANLAADPELNVVGAVSLGGPVAQVASGSTPVVSVEHAEDLVPATAGHGVTADGRLAVERSLGRLEPTLEHPLPAHSLTAYRETAGLLDDSDDARLAEFRRLLEAHTGGASAVTTEWHAERVSPPGPEPGSGSGCR